MPRVGVAQIGTFFATPAAQTKRKAHSLVGGSISRGPRVNRQSGLDWHLRLPGLSFLSPVTPQAAATFRLEYCEQPVYGHPSLGSQPPVLQAGSDGDGHAVRTAIHPVVLDRRRVKDEGVDCVEAPWHMPHLVAQI